MIIEQLNAFSINGFKVRTNNHTEADTETAKIAPLWHHFYHDLMPHLHTNARIYGIYTGYASNHEGDFDVIACTDQKILYPIDGLVTRHIPTERYLKFTKRGAMPQTVIDLWQEIWAYFGSVNCIHRRIYTQDIERYRSTQEVEIYISIQ